MTAVGRSPALLWYGRQVKRDTQMNRNTSAVTLAVLACSQFLGACAFQPITPAPDAIRASISSGDTVRVTTLNGQEHTFRVTEIGPEQLSGESEEVAYGQIAQLEKREINRTTLWVLVGLAVAGLAGGGGGSSY